MWVVVQLSRADVFSLRKISQFDRNDSRIVGLVISNEVLNPLPACEWIDTTIAALGTRYFTVPDDGRAGAAAQVKKKNPVAVVGR
jgi:SAM-dependent MidA family methyltransferase